MELEVRSLELTPVWTRIVVKPTAAGHKCANALHRPVESATHRGLSTHSITARFAAMEAIGVRRPSLC